MNRKSDLDKDLERLLGEAERAGVARPEPRGGSADSGRRASTPDTATQRRAISASDPAVQVLESAHQILMMIGANPRAIRPILAQRRLTKETILEAAGSVSDRAGTALADLDTLQAGRRAAHGDAAAQIRAQMETEDAETRQVADQEDAILAECDGVRARIGRIQARFGIAELPAVEPPEEERHGLFGRLLEELTDNRVLGAFVRVRRGDTSQAAKPDGRILRADDPAVVSVQNMDEFVQAADPALPQAELYRMWCELAATPDADVRGALAAVQDLVTRQVAQSTEVKRQNDEAHRAEMARLKGQLDAANAAWARFEADERTQRTYLTGLQDRAARVSEVYQTL